MQFIVVAILATAFLILVHEAGHFVLAKAVGVPVDTFTIGYGRPIVKTTIRGTTYGIGAFPLGGYVKINGLDPREAELLPEAEAARFRVHPFWKRLVIVSGGPLANIMLAVFLFAAVFMIGVPQPTTVIEKVLPDSPAAKAGLQANDRITAVDGRRVAEWDDAVNLIRSTKKTQLEVEVQRADKRVRVTTGVSKRQGVNFIGVQVKVSSEASRVGFFRAIYQGVISTFFASIGFVQALYLIIVGKIPFRPVSPVGIVQVTSQAAQHGVIVFLDFLAFITIVLGISNLLPIIPLDGGRVVLWAVERVKGSPVKTATVVILQVIGVGLLIVLVAMALYLDIFQPLPNPFK